MSETTVTFKDETGLLHFPGPNPGTQYTLCGLDAGAMTREDRPVEWAGIWCTECMKASSE